MTEQAHSRPTQNRLLGILLRVGATSCFGFMAALIKLGNEAGASTIDLLFYRFAFGLLPLLLWIVWSRNPTVWKTKRPRAHLWRAFLGLGSAFLGFTALRYLPLAEATTIGFAAPLFAVSLSALVLGEQVGRHRWSAVAIGFAGVTIVTRPQGGHLPSIGLLVAVLAALTVACSSITIRQIGKTEKAQTTVFWFTIIGAAALAPAMLVSGSNSLSTAWPILAGIGLIGGCGQIFLTASLRYAPVSVIAPFDYVQLVWAVLLGWLIWNDRPVPTTWAGAVLIVASGLYTLYRERRLRKDELNAAALL